MKNQDFRRTAGSLKYDDFDLVYKTQGGTEYELASVEIDFDKKKVMLVQAPKK